MLHADNQEYYTNFEDFAVRYFNKDEEIVKLFSTNIFHPNDDNTILEEYYQHPNYKITEYNPTSEFCHIFFPVMDYIIPMI